MPERSSVAYVLKGYPRRSEIFIASELYRVERAGLPVRLYVLKPGDPDEPHPVVGRIRATPQYLPRTTSLSGTGRLRWLAANLPAFLPSLRRTARRRPAGLARAAALAVREALGTRRSPWSWPKKVFLRDFLLAVALADRLLDAPDVRHLHAHFAHGATTVTWFAAVIAGLPFSFTGHAKDIYSEQLNPRGLLRRKLLAARFAVTCTEANRRHLERIAPEAVVHRLYHGLNADFTRLVNGAAPAAEANGELRLLGVGRLVPKKGFDVLVDACALLERRSVPFSARIVGEDGEHGDELRRRVAGLGLERRIRLVGPTGQAGLLDEYRRATAVCLPCRILDNGDRDGIPNVLVEAMACGVPVVTTPVSGIPELVHDGENGLLVPPDDPAALAEAILRVHRDAGLRRRLADASRATVRDRFDGDRLAGRLASLFGEPS
jgi:glycosyltransferase involved in cell wall biosynthesis